jgi:phosphoribosylamine--glycine ligase
MKVLVLGTGAREHALVVALSRDPDVDELAAAPGNPGIAQLAECLPVDLLDGAAVAELAAGWGADLVVVGPEAPLVAGVADAVREAGVACFGPTREAAALEGSKAFAKAVMAEAGVPTAMAHLCRTTAEVEEALDSLGAPHVVKDDGLAAGKGVVVTDDRAAALAHAQTCLARGGDAEVVVEEYLDGPEVSVFCITDGTTVVPLAPAQDFKRLQDDDAGPNTGGMGAYSPLPWVPPELVDEVVARVAQPTVDVMARRGTPFAGLLYVGLAMTGRGPEVVEFNARFGDPETQVVLPRLLTPLGALLMAAATGDLAGQPPLRWSSTAAVTVVLASPGYPAAPRTGGVLEGLDDAAGVPGASVLHAGTALADGAVTSSGGRVLSVVGTGPDLEAARATAYTALDRITLDGGQHRRDIAAAAAAGSAGGRVAAVQP